MALRSFAVTGGTVNLALPPKNAAPSPDGTRAMRAALDSITAKHAQALTSYAYYEVVDQWLGPWGKDGYPIGYGKYYCVLFNKSDKLQKSEQARKWVDETTIKLQEALTDFIVRKYESNTLARLTEEELRKAAFQSHAKAYDDGGLARVALLDPLMILFIATIPAKEFHPTSKDFGPTFAQVFETLGRVVRSSTGMAVAALMPAHSGFFRRAAAADAHHQREVTSIGPHLARIKAAITAGHMDHEPWLDKIIGDLNRKRFDSEEAARYAREVILTATSRKKAVAAKHEEMLKGAAAEVRRKTGMPSKTKPK